MLSQTSEYALRAMSCLAYAPDELTTTTTLAEMTKVPSNYLAKVLQSLAQADLITGRRGVGGGYRLARPSAEISLLDIINSIDPIERITTCPLGLSNHSENLCPLHRAVDNASKAVIDQFGDTSLQDIISALGSNKPLCNTEQTARYSISIGKS